MANRKPSPAPLRAKRILTDVPRPSPDSLLESFYGGGVKAVEPRAPVDDAEMLAIEKIVPNPRQPRRIFQEDAIEDLKESIREVGLIQPIVVRPQGDRYEIVCGERRFRACVALGHRSIRAEVRELDDLATFKLALSENVHRESLQPLEEAEAYAELMARESVSRAELARILSVDRRRVSEKLQLLTLPDEVRGALSARADTFTERHALLLAHAPDGHNVIDLARRCLDQAWSTRRLQEEIARAAERHDNRPRLFNNIHYAINKRGGFTLTVRARSRQEVARTIGELESKLEDLRKAFNEELSARADKGGEKPVH
jgi:ParB/RepB/Spo0J family partition protein